MLSDAVKMIMALINSLKVQKTEDNNTFETQCSVAVENNDEYRRCIFGVVSNFVDNLYVIEKGNHDHHFERPLDFSWNFETGDRVRMTGREDDDGIFTVEKVEPLRKKEEFGRITKMAENYVVFEDNVLMMSEDLSNLQLHKECKYIAIETDQRCDGIRYDWRVAKILDILEAPNKESIAAKILMQDDTFTIAFNNLNKFSDVYIKQFNIPENLRCYEYEDFYQTHEQLTEEFTFLRSNNEIDEESFIDKLHLGVYLDEIALENAFRKYRIERSYFVLSDDKESLRLVVKGVSEKRPSLIIGDAIFATPNPLINEQQKIYKGYIRKVENDAICVQFNEEFYEFQKGKKFTVEFNFSRTMHRFQHHAIDTLTNTKGLGKSFLFPDYKDCQAATPQVDVSLVDGQLKLKETTINWFDNKLNNHQKNFVFNALRGEHRPLPYVLYGPPGTGKTLTLVELALQLYTLLPNSNIIIATPSNSAANLFTDALVKSEKLKNPHDFIRFVSNNQFERELIPTELLRYCGTISYGCGLSSTNMESGLRKNCSKSNIMNYRIIIGTLNCFGSMMRMSFPNDHFTHVLIDEAAQSSEPSNYIPLTFLRRNSGQVILAGDPKQLGPMSVSQYVMDFEMETPLLTRLLYTNKCYSKSSGPNMNDYDPRFVTQLKLNYRSHSSIMKFYNELFYENFLEGAVDGEKSHESQFLDALLQETLLWGREKENFGVYFVDVDGRNAKEKNSPSWYNQNELNAIMSLLIKMSMCNVPLKDVGVITPYALQVKKIQKRVSEVIADTDLKVGTVEEFQGQERSVILVSTVRTEHKFSQDKTYNLGFIHCNKRMNVAISRAKSLLVVFGNSKALKENDKWRQFMDTCERNETFITKSIAFSVII
ncbi:CLUMA_CG017902, isoform A [Clunio marinus]|uniref:RNA helicase n=1 Tax=Clunio marinus TaxID=568069 RepID=A0A1J1IYT4_9DIPT|nr:CLUMA_CG017902, isoform A [Clunio marinus]